MKTLIDEAFNIGSNRKMLKLQDQCVKMDYIKNLFTIPRIISLETRGRSLNDLDWSCKPRHKPLAILESVHDLPKLKIDREQVMDWSSRGLIVAVFNKKLVVWYPNTDMTIVYNNCNADVVAFSPGGEFLAMASVQAWEQATAIIQVWHISQTGRKTLCCTRAINTGPDERISATAWDSNEKHLVLYVG